MKNFAYNFKEANADLSCVWCKTGGSNSQEHLLSSIDIMDKCPQIKYNKTVKYEDSFTSDRRNISMAADLHIQSDKINYKLLAS